MRRIVTSPGIWLLGFIVWCAYLFTLSSNPGSVTEGAPEIPHIDKILHFGYFMGGGGLLTTAILLWKGTATHPSIRIAIPLALLCTIAALDEWRQSFSPGRSGNDPIDWTADALGSLTGIFLANRFHALLRKISSPAAEIS
jgi:VanZ family protein